jgi:cytochrome P450
VVWIIARIQTCSSVHRQHARALLRPQFARDQVSDLRLEEVHVQNLLRVLPTETSGWTAKVDLQPLFFNLTLDSATEFLFGQTINSQLAGLLDQHNLLAEPEKDGKRLDWSTFGEDWDHATMTLGTRGRLKEAYWVYSPKSFRQSCKRIHEFADYCVNRALSDGSSALKAKDTSEAPRRDKYIFLEELLAQTRDPAELRSQLLNILLAGRDTTAGLLGWTFYMLVRHPYIYAKLRAIIVDQFGTYSQPRNLTFANLKSCTYLQYVLNEILRLYPSVPINSRRCVRDTTLPRGGGADGNSPVYIRRGQEINYLVHVMHHRKDIWGEDVEEFKPERWQGKRVGWEYLPFNGGPRICLGQQFALTEAGYVVTRMMQKFDRMINEDERNITRHVLSVTTSTDGCWASLHEAGEGGGVGETHCIT